MRIRPATEDDTEAIASIVIEADTTAGEWAPPGWTPPTYEAELRKAHLAVSSPTRRTFVAETGGEVGGYASLDVPNAPVAELKRLFIRPEHWGIGIATALLDEMVAIAFAEGYRSMRLFTPTTNTRARRFYEREGWHAAGVRMHDELSLELTEYRRALGLRRR
jgi:ribosomal protein S18 acetylase RimI-like enzyme